MKKLTFVLGLLLSVAANANSKPLVTMSAKLAPQPLTAQEWATLSLTRTDFNYDGIVKLNNCSGAVIRFEGSKESDLAVMMTNGHCYSAGAFGGMMKPNEFVHQKDARRSVEFLSPSGQLTRKSVNTTKVLYATMTGTDVALYELPVTYSQLKNEYNVNALVLDSAKAAAKDAIEILSGYFQVGWACQIDRFIYQLHEANYIMKDSIRYTKECDTKHGTSGSPILSRNTRRVVGINNTGNDSGQRCTMDNPCEVSEDNSVFVEKGIHYGQQTYQIYSCLNAERKIDLSLQGCKLFKGARH